MNIIKRFFSSLMVYIFRSSGNLQVAGGVSRSRAASETPDREILSGNWKVGKKISMKGVRSS
jgi:hypothetical protein